jgi:hypothetical protein
MDECPICLAPLYGSAFITVSCCKKQFHAACLIKCTSQKNECPMCRAKDCINLIPEPEQPREEVRLQNRSKVITNVIIYTSFMFAVFLVFQYGPGIK